MKATSIIGVYKEKNRIYTENLPCCKGSTVYNERIVYYRDREFRSWNPYRSKLAAAISNGLKISFKTDSKILYLGAATGTTVSHVSDIVRDGWVYAVENSPVAMKKLLYTCGKRHNVIPVLADANHPERYGSIVSGVDFVYQDVSQRNQAEIFKTNVFRYLKKNGEGVLMVKARSIDVSLKPKKAYELVCLELEDAGLKIERRIDLHPYDKDHMVILVSYF